MKKMTSFRLSAVELNRLNELSDKLLMDKTDILEELINACFDSYCVNFNVHGFERFTKHMQERVSIIKNS